MPVFDIKVLDWNILPLIAGEEMLHEQVASRAVQAALLDLFAPKLVIKAPTGKLREIDDRSPRRPSSSHTQPR